MADSDIILLEDEVAEEEGAQYGKKESLLKDKKKLAVIGAFLLAIIVIIVLVVIFMPTKESQKSPDGELIKKLSDADKSSTITLSRLDHMVKKANLLYERGIKQDALKLYEKIANYSESVSYYNLGVAQMKEENYASSIESFQKAINAGENRCVAAINAAVCALHLKEDKLFSYYVDLAYAFLKDEASSPLYSYYYALVMYYKSYFFEAISPLVNRTSDAYASTQDHMLSNIFTVYGDETNSLFYLQKSIEDRDYFNMGLMYARMGEYDIAASHIVRSLNNAEDKLKVKSALELVNLKRGYFQDAVTTLSEFAQLKLSPLHYYPIRAKLSETIFDINIAQERFRRDFSINHRNSLKILFYFTGYKVFDAERTKNIIQKGSMNIYIDEVKNAKELLSIGGTVSEVNYNIALAIGLVLDNKLREANRIFEDMIKKYQNHPILHFNLALSYAQLGNYEKAYFHFLKAYHLDGENITAGIYAVATAKLTNRDYVKLLDSVVEDLDRYSRDTKEREFFVALINFVRQNPLNVVNWGHNDDTQKPLHIALKALSSFAISDNKEFLGYSEDLLKIIPNDLMAGILNLLAQNSHRNVKDFSLGTQEFFRDNRYDMDGFYFGSAVLRELYVRLAYITGTINYVKEHTELKLQTFAGDTRGLLQAMAYINIYTRNFEESFVAYTTLIDNLKVQDSGTLFLSSVAAIGGGHHENAAANLELSILTDDRNFESRYALGLLYQEADNGEGAAIQFGVMGNNGFVSEYFDFDIETKRRDQDGF